MSTANHLCGVQTKYGRRPYTYNRDDAANVLQLAQDINSEATHKVDIDQVPLAQALLGRL